MGIFRKLFGKKPAAASAAAADDDVGDIVASLQREGAGGEVGDIAVDSSPKEVCRYIFQRMMAGATPDSLMADLQGRGFKAKIADMYIQLIRATMFKGR